MIKAKLNYFRMMPRKLRLIAKTIKKLSVVEAERELLFRHKKGAKVILKLLKSAINNAKNQGYQPEELYVQNIVVQEGPKNLKRFRPRSRGRVGRITKKLSHLEIILEKSQQK